MAKVGYARVSSVGQSLDVQREKLDSCDKLFEEKRSGTTDARPQLKECLNYVRDGDQLIVTRIDRLARPAVCCSTCLVPSDSSKPKSVPSARWTASKRRRIAVFSLANAPRFQKIRSLSFAKSAQPER